MLMIIFDAPNESMCNEFAKLMRSKSKISIMGELNFFLSCKLNKLRKEIIHQQKYIKELLKMFDLDSAKTIYTPIVTATGWIWMNLVFPLMKRNT